MSVTELALRIGILLPLGFVTMQAVLLRRMLRSRAWTLLAAGFVTFFLLRASSLVGGLPRMASLAVMLLAYLLVAAGFHTLRNDLRRVLRGVVDTGADQ